VWDDGMFITFALLPSVLAVMFSSSFRE
jgi:hypothetical protein